MRFSLTEIFSCQFFWPIFIRQQELRGLPGATVTVPAPPDYRAEAPLSTIPGSEYDNQQYQQPDARVNSHLCNLAWSTEIFLTGSTFSQSSAFVDGFRTAVHGDLADAWDDLHRPPILPHALGRESESHFAEFDQIYNSGASSHLQPTFDGRILYLFHVLIFAISVLLACLC